MRLKPCCCTPHPGAGREQLAQALLQRYPERFALPRKQTDRKPPGKGDRELLPPELECVKPEALSKLLAQPGQAVWSAQEGASGTTQVLTADALHDVAATGERSGAL